MDLGISGWSFIVTGGSGGLGLAVAQCLVAEGASVVIAGRDEERLAAAASQLGPRCHPIQSDVGDPEGPARLVDAARSTFGRVDGALISQGGPAQATAATIDDQQLEEQLLTTAIGPIRHLRDIGGSLSGGGSLLALTSSTMVEPIPGFAGSNTGRPAVWGYAKTLAGELGPKGIRVNVIAPGRFDTDRVRVLDRDEAAARGVDLATVVESSVRGVPLGRAGQPEELGHVGAFLLSPRASYVTGATWIVDGGRSRGR